MQLGIRLHDVTTETNTLESRAKLAREEGFKCVHLALAKVIKGVTFDDCALTEGLACHVRRVFEAEKLDIAVLGCYLNLAHPDKSKLRDIQSRYFGNLRVASLMGACMVGTETGAPNEQYKLDANTHSDAALKTFMYNLEPVLDCAERYGVTLSIEPVWNHIVYSPQRAKEVLDAMQSRNLRIILDPVNLLSWDNADNRDAVIAEAIDLLGERVAMVHLKDFVREDGKLVSVAAGDGEMDYGRVLAFMKERKPFIHATLENTVNANAVRSRELIEKIYAEI